MTCTRHPCTCRGAHPNHGPAVHLRAREHRFSLGRLLLDAGALALIIALAVLA